MRFLHITGANLALRCPPGMENCQDIVVREDIFDGVTYRSMELELTPEERQAVINGGTLQVTQVGGAWLPVAVAVLTPTKEIVIAE